jgi:hypothetical protein
MENIKQRTSNPEHPIAVVLVGKTGLIWFDPVGFSLIYFDAALILG